MAGPPEPDPAASSRRPRPWAHPPAIRGLPSLPFPHDPESGLEPSALARAKVDPGGGPHATPLGRPAQARPDRGVPVRAGHEPEVVVKAGVVARGRRDPPAEADVLRFRRRARRRCRSCSAASRRGPSPKPSLGRGWSLLHLLETITALQARSVHFRSLGDPVDAASPQGRFTLQILSAMAEFERELIHRERAMSGLASARAEGRTSGNLGLVSGDRTMLSRLRLARRDAFLESLNRRAGD